LEEERLINSRSEKSGMPELVTTGSSAAGVRSLGSLNYKYVARFIYLLILFYLSKKK
jgi:hypothetical protein